MSVIVSKILSDRKLKLVDEDLLEGITPFQEHIIIQNVVYVIKMSYLCSH